MTQDVRREQLAVWVHSLAGWGNATLELATDDASFRRYFRASQDGRTAIVMDSPPDKEPVAPFIDMTARLYEAGVHVPEIFAQNPLDGFLLLEDFGNTLLLNAIHPGNADHLYADAMQALLKVQQADVEHLPDYHEEMLYRELNIMPEWFLGQHLGFAPHDIPQGLIEDTFGFIVEELLEQPVAFTHRDFHSRNLMLTATDSPGVIDHQGAVLGPVTYDLVSLLRDCYIAWPQQRVDYWSCQFRKMAIAAGTIPPVDEPTFKRWFDLTGLQRHIKVLGIFARLNHRDGKSGYLKDLPLTLSYVMQIGSRYQETARLVEWMRQAGIPERVGTVVIPH